nr:uncharacterized protein LOC112771946 [Arachis hypogaea]
MLARRTGREPRHRPHPYPLSSFHSHSHLSPLTSHVSSLHSHSPSSHRHFRPTTAAVATSNFEQPPPAPSLPFLRAANVANFLPSIAKPPLDRQSLHRAATVLPRQLCSTALLSLQRRLLCSIARPFPRSQIIPWNFPLLMFAWKLLSCPTVLFLFNHLHCISKLHLPLPLPLPVLFEFQNMLQPKKENGIEVYQFTGSYKLKRRHSLGRAPLLLQMQYLRLRIEWKMSNIEFLFV